MASMEPGAPRLPEQEMVDLRADVVAQIEELSTLVGDLVDLTRDDAGQVVHEPVDMSDVVDRSLERVRRRRNDIHFDVDVTPWQMYGDAAGLSRAVLNLLDNAAKWSPPGGHVGVTMRQLDPSHAELVVADHGPGFHRKSAGWCSSGSIVRRRHGPCPAPASGWRSSRRSCSTTAACCASRTPSRAASPGYLLLCAAARTATAAGDILRDRAGGRPGRRRDRGGRAGGRRRGELWGIGERYLSGLSVRAGKVGLRLLLNPAVDLPKH